ncbi:hypothetical protein MAP00_001271 [Monascus purpureus]|nr:hypothetical protein MAP00_001271 [Monascus purpureus]
MHDVTNWLSDESTTYNIPDKLGELSVQSTHVLETNHLLGLQYTSIWIMSPRIKCQVKPLLDAWIQQRPTRNEGRLVSNLAMPLVRGFQTRSCQRCRKSMCA